MITNEFNKEIRRKSDILRDLGYTDATVALRQHYWKEYYGCYGSWEVTEQTMGEFLFDFYGVEKGNINLSKRQYECRAAIRNLLELHQHGKIINYHTPWFKDMPWVLSFKPVVDEFLESIAKKELKRQSIVDYERALKRLTNYLHSIDIESFEEVKSCHLSSFLVDSINEIVRNLKAMLSKLRMFFRYIYLHGYNDDDLSLVIPRSNVLLKRKHIPSTWTREDVDRILGCIDVANPVGKRDYAMILLVARLGIRVSDVIHLRFDNIKWDRNCFHITQQKTNEPMVLPLFEDVGTAIIDYLQNGRPPADIDRVFITHRPPFRAFSDNNHLYGMFNQYLHRSGIVITPEKNHGLHSLRHTLASELLRNEIPLPVISEILGHRSLNSTMQYLRADSEQLRYCTLIEGENYAS